jgi:pantoate--beta-alanine ligase
MKVVKEVRAMQEISEFNRLTYKKIGFVPTMGYLHDGHVSLIQKAKEECDIVIVSIYVNPTQFLQGEDFETYPRDFDRDYEMCKNAGAEYVFYPDSLQMYNRNHMTNIMISNITGKLEGEVRPGHFIGVATIVLKLFNVVKPHKAYFGQKDAQQVVVLKRMANDLNLDIDIVVCPTIREENGLAKSSRNTYLTDAEKREASILYAALEKGKDWILTRSDDLTTEEIRELMKEVIDETVKDAKVQYIAITDNELLNEIQDINSYKGEVLISLAVKMGKTRLIDNIIFSKN